MIKTLLLTSLLFLSIGSYSQILIDEDFSTASGSTPPAGWTSLDNAGNGEVWIFDDPTLYTSAPLAGIAAIFDSDSYGNNGTAEDATLVSPVFDASGIGSVILTFDHYFYDSFTGGSYTVEVFDGTSWTSVLTSTSTTSDPQAESIDISTATNNSVTAQVRFTYEGDWSYYWIVDNIKVELVSCPQPSSILFSSITSSTATVDWTAGNSETNWNIEYGATGFTLGGGTQDVVTGTPTFDFTLLTPLTDYDFYVQADCGGGDESAWVGPFTFSTTCIAPVISTYPWTEDFESTNVDELTCGWSMENLNSDAIEWSVQDNNANSGVNSLYIFYNSSVAMNDWVYTPELVLEMDSTYQLLFSYAVDDFYPEDLEVFIGNGQSSAMMTTQLIDLPGIDNANYINEIVTFTVPADGSYFIGFHGYSEADQNFISIDDVNVIYAPACPDITAITLDGVNSNSADISWTAGATETAWNVEYGLTGFTLGTGTPDVALLLPEYSAGGLAPLTTYDFYVQADCGGEQASWVGPFTFTTTCVAPVISTYPWTENFDSETLPELPCGWSVDNVNGDAYTWITDDYLSNSGANALYIRWNGSQAMDDWAFTPEFVLQAGVNYAFTFSYVGSGTTFPEKMELYQGQTASVLGMTTQLIDLPNIVNSSYLTETIEFTVPVSGSYYFGFHGYSDANEFFISVDDLMVEEVICEDVTSITLDDVTDQTADISWTAGGTETDWNIEYGTIGFTQGTGTSDVVNTSPTYSLSTLTPETQYDFYVQADCGSDSSAWVGPFTFTTLCTPLQGNSLTDPLVIASLPFTGTGNTSDCYTNEVGETSPDVYYTFTTSDCSDSIDLDLCNSTFDSYIRLLDENGVELDFNDNGCGTNGQILGTVLNPSTVYFVVVEGAGSATGAFELNITEYSTVEDASFTFSEDSLCLDGSTVMPVITGTTGGMFTGTTGLDVDPANGTVDPQNSVAGNHYLIYSVGNGVCEGSDSVEIVVYDCNTSGIEESILAGTSIFPNPSAGVISVNLPVELDAEITLIDFAGKEVNFFQNKISDKQYEIDLSQLVDGVYFLKIATGDTHLIEKVILKK